MGVRYPSVASTTIVANLPASAVETIICTLPALNIPLDNAQIFLSWFAAILTGATVTALVFRIRRSALITGASIGAAVWTLTIGAAANACTGGQYVDTPGAVAGQQYVLTCSQTGGSGVGTVNDVSLIAFAL